MAGSRTNDGHEVTRDVAYVVQGVEIFFQPESSGA